MIATSNSHGRGAGCSDSGAPRPAADAPPAVPPQPTLAPERAGGPGPHELRRFRITASFYAIGFLTAGLGLAGFPLQLSGEEPPGAPAARFASRAEAIYQEMQKRYATGSNLVEIAWEFGRACYDRADFARDDAERARLAEQGIAACRQAIRRDSATAAGHYYLGLNQGQLARTKSLGALKLVREMEQAFTKARELDQRFDHGGADRNLGLLYLEAPGWPASIGSKGKAEQHLRRAVELFPDYPGNRLCLCEAVSKWGDDEALEREARLVPAVLRRARAELKGEAWEQSWDEWDGKWRRIRARLPGLPAEHP